MGINGINPFSSITGSPLTSGNKISGGGITDANGFSSLLKNAAQSTESANPLGISASNLSSGNRIAISGPNDSADLGSMVKDAVESIDNSQKSAEQEIAKAVSGESPDLHKTIIALQTADLKFQLGLQVRNKLLGAYDEIMRMQV